METLSSPQFTEMRNLISMYRFINYEKYKSNKFFNRDEVIWFTDGSCTKNGKKSSAGGYAAICVDGFKKGLILYGKVNDTEIKATNIRAEGLAIQNVFDNLLKNRNNTTWKNATIYTDSEFWVKMIYNYMPKWSGAAFDSKANPDLTKKIWTSYRELNSGGKSVKLQHIYAHNKDNSAYDEDIFKRYCHDNNNIVDMLANIAREMPSYRLYEEYISQ